MKNKIARLILRDKAVQVRLIVLVVLMIGLGMLSMTMKGLKRHLVRFSQEKELVLKIPEMERDIKLSAEPTAIVVVGQPKKKEYVLEGIQIRNEVTCAIINGDIYKEGDAVDEYQVLKILRNLAVLENKETQAQKILYLKEQ